jgi:hypothetical protein
MMEGRKSVLLSTLIIKNVDADVYGSHTAFMYRCGRECLDYEFVWAAPKRTGVDMGRNAIVEFAIENGYDCLFFYDDDTRLHASAMKLMLEAMEKHPQVDVLSGKYHVRSYSFEVMAFVVEDREQDKWKLLKEEVSSYIDPETGLIGPLRAVGSV